MNKKIFAALASATMALSATGSLAVFAEDFDVVPEAVGDNGVGSGVIIPNNGIEINVENFPDAGFREAILNSATTTNTKFYDADGNQITNFPTTYGSKISKGMLESVTKIELGSDVEDTAGVKYFTNLEEIDTLKGNTNSLETVNLADNTKLETIDFENVPNLTTLSIPATKTLQNLTVIGGTVLDTTSPAAPAVYVPYSGDSLTPDAFAPISELDLSANKGLESVVVVGTNVANLDLSNNIYLTYVNVAGNKINTLNLTNNDALTALYCYSNQLYSLDLSDSDQLETVVAGYNILQELDVTAARGLVSLYVQSNELRALDLSNNKDLLNLDVRYNHIGALDLTSNKNLYSRGATAKYTPQIVYVDSAYDGVNLADSFDDLDSDNVALPAGSDATWTKKTGVLEIPNASATYEYNVGKDVVAQHGVMKVSVMKEAVLNRLYNPNSGEHFYTRDIDEKDALVKLGWQDEGVGWTSPTKSNTPVYRLYNPNAGDHHYTTRSTERDTLVSVGWKYEGVGWYSYTEAINISGYTNAAGASKPIAAVDVVREYNPNAKAAGAHNYTVNRAENDFLVSIGWLDEGIAWQAMK